MAVLDGHATIVTGVAADRGHDIAPNGRVPEVPVD